METIRVGNDCGNYDCILRGGDDNDSSPTSVTTGAEQSAPTTSSTPEPQQTTEPQPTVAPTSGPEPTAVPTAAPTSAPQPRAVPTAAPTSAPQPTAVPTATPTSAPQPTATPTSSGIPSKCSSDQYNCGDFSSQSDAQRMYNYCYPFNGDIHRLDGDNNGLACDGSFR